jgi:hypothetical protein
MDAFACARLRARVRACAPGQPMLLKAARVVVVDHAELPLLVHGETRGGGGGHTDGSAEAERFAEWLCVVGRGETPGTAGPFTRFMFKLNAVGVLAHAAALLVEWLALRVRFGMKLALTSVQLSRRPSFMTGNGETDGEFEWERVHLEDGEVYVTWLALSIHLLALASHLAVCASLAPFVWGWTKRPWPTDWYRLGIYRCRAPWRWAEYAFSATAMVAFLGIVMGVRDHKALASLCVLCATTMLFGWMTEVHSSGGVTQVQCALPERALSRWLGHAFLYTWAPGSRRDRLLWHHALGYVPFVAMVGLIVHGYLENKDALRETNEEWPVFIDFSVIGTIALFSLFGVTQLLQQVRNDGPSWYWAGEASYVVLSFTAKAWLVLLASVNALREGAQFDSLLQARF